MTAEGQEQIVGTDNTVTHDLVPPSAGAMIMSLRALGYSFQAAIADLVDNSISAGASRIEISMHWEEEHSVISVLDNGRGMTRETLVNAMRAGSTSPLEARTPGDLGRFGMGLKTASFSQCRCTTVATRVAGGGMEVRRWDLDHVAATGEWRLLHGFQPGSDVLARPLEDLPHGTLVLWERPDRLVGSVAGNAAARQRVHRQFLENAERLEHHLATTFHRFLRGAGRRQILLNGHPVAPWDPLLGDWETIFQLPEERLVLDGLGIRVQGTVLPHPSRIEPGREQEAAGPGGWNRQQGLHIYRDDRLLVAGGWAGLGLEADDRFRLARVRVDIPSALDQQWGVDIRKSRVTVPAALRDDLRRIARMTRDHALQVYRHRVQHLTGGQTPGSSESLWQVHSSAAGYRHRINRAHPMVQALRQAGAAPRQLTDTLLTLIEQTLPVERIWMTGAVAEQAPTTPPPDALPGEIADLAREVLRGLIGSGMDTEQAVLRIRLMEPFCDCPQHLLLNALIGRGHHDTNN